MILSLRTWLILGGLAALVIYLFPEARSLVPGQGEATFGPDSLFGEDAAGNCVQGYLRGRDGVCRTGVEAVKTYIPDLGRLGI